jgi:hypothetical protein
MGFQSFGEFWKPSGKVKYIKYEAKIRRLTGNRGGTGFAPTGFFPHHEHGDAADVKIAGNIAGYF